MLNAAQHSAAIQATFDENLHLRGEVGAAVAIWQDGEEVVHCWGGHTDGSRSRSWSEETLILVWSATKGPASASVLLAAQQNGVDLETPVRTFWPEFAGGGKSQITLEQVLSHRAGLAAIEQGDISMFEHDRIIAAIEAQAPNWEDRSAHGYGPRTFGFLTDEIVRRLAGIPLGEFWRREIAAPLGLEIWIGLPEAFHDRVASILPPKAGCTDDGDRFMRAMADADSLTRKAFAAPTGVRGISGMNSPVVRSASFPAFGGIASARGLAKFYGRLACEGGGLFSKPTLQAMETLRAEGDDLTLQVTTAFSAGFMKDPLKPNGTKLRATFGNSLRAFGHPGAGGSLAFADPENRLGFAYVMNQMGLGALPGERALRLVGTLYA